MLTRRQKNSLRGITAALTCSAFLSAFLIYTNISGTEKTEPVVFSDILEGAVAYSDNDDTPVVTLASDKLLETMFSEQYATFTLVGTPDHSVTFIPPATFYSENTPAEDNNAVTEPTEDTTSEKPRYSGSLNIPENPNEITLLSGELDQFRTEATTTQATTTTTTSSATSTTTTLLSNVSPVTYAVSPVTTTTTTTRATTYTPPWWMTTTVSATTTLPTTATTTRDTTVTTKKTTTATAANTTSHTSKTPFTNIGGGVFSTDDTIYLTLFKLVNDARREAGVPELWYSARVHEVCEIRAGELSSYYSHNRPDGTRFSTAFKEIGINYSKCGENIAYGRNMFETPEEVFRAWMDSESHRENILSPDFECVAFGLSVLKVGNDTYYYWAQEFASL
ncbi:MAG: CAP domain-containing protein [Ruminiclostridium sp.]|nr:CAP domain-containing protein [Ruminiclostridium sp.]